MRIISNWFRRAPAEPQAEPAPTPAPAAATWAPSAITINPGDQERIEQAFFRLDAMARHMEQRDTVSPRRVQEFHAEARALISALRTLIDGIEDPAAHDHMTARLDELVERHVRHGLEARL